MRSAIKIMLTAERVKELIIDKQYDVLLDALKKNTITPYHFNTALRELFSNDMFNLDFRQLYKELWCNNDDAESLGFIAWRLQQLLVLYPDSEFAPNLIIELMSSCKTRNGIHHLYRVLASYQVNKYTLDVLDKVDMTAKNNALEYLIPLTIYKCNVKLLQQLSARYPEQVKSFLENTDAQSRKLIERANLMLKSDPEKGDEMCRLLREFNEHPGMITMEGGMLTCARISNEMKFEFNPTLLQQDDHNASFMDEYVSLLRDMPLPLREKFIIVGYHWVCGDIQIDEKGNIAMILIDSLGSGGSLEKNIYKSFKKIFPNANIEFFITNEKRQHSHQGCSVFALDDVKQLFTIDKYLDKRYEQSGLYGYLRDHAIPVTSESSNIFLTNSKLPIKFLRTMQSKLLLSTILPGRPIEEQALVINRKGETTEKSAKKSFCMDRNIRMNNKLLINFADKNAEYLLKTNPETVKMTMRRFTIDGLKERVKILNASHKLIQ